MYRGLTYQQPLRDRGGRRDRGASGAIAAEVLASEETVSCSWRGAMVGSLSARCFPSPDLGGMTTRGDYAEIHLRLLGIETSTDRAPASSYIEDP